MLEVMICVRIGGGRGIRGNLSSTTLVLMLPSPHAVLETVPLKPQVVDRRGLFESVPKGLT